MPCRDYDPEPDPTHAEMASLRSRLDRLTRLMCDTGKDAESRDYLHQMRGDFREWYAEHRKADKMREEEEAKEKRLQDLQKAVLSKLTHEEIAALAKYGLKK